MYNHEDILKQFGLNIKAERSRKGLSQEAFAEKMNKDRTFVSRIECGRVNMSLKKIVELTNYLGADLKDVLRF